MSATRSSEPQIDEALELAIEARLLDLHTNCFGFVTAYDAATQTCSVRFGLRPGVRNEEGERVSEEVPILQHVPVLTLGASGISISFPLEVGARVLLVFMEGSIDRGIDRVQDPGSDRRFDLNDAVAIPWERVVPRTGTLTLNAPKVHIGGECVETPGPLSDAVLTAKTTIDPFTGQTHAALNNGSSTVFGKG